MTSIPMISGDLSPLISRLRASFPPKGKPSLRRAYMANTTLNGEYIADKYIVTTTSYFRPVALLCSAKEGLQKGFPSGGRKLQAVCRVQRQMRGG